MKILLIGAHGMLGSDIKKVFADQEVISWDKEDVDITNKHLVDKEIYQAMPDFIINTAAYTDVDGAETNKDLAFAVNALGVRHIAQSARKANAPVVHFSTDYVFAGDKEDGYYEDDVPKNPVNAYGESKLQGEINLKGNCDKYYLIRTSWLYGSSAEPRQHKNFVETMLKLSETHDELNVINDQHGRPTYTHDLALYTKHLVQRAAEQHPAFPFGTYHATNTGVTTWYDFAKKIFELAGKEVKVNPIPTSEYPTPAKRPEWGELHNTKGKQLKPWQDALDEYLKAR